MAVWTVSFVIFMELQIVCSLVELQGPASLIIGTDRLQITCLPSNGTENWVIDNIQLFSNRSDTLGTHGSRIVSIYYDRLINSGKIGWQDPNLEPRATAIGNIDTPSSANLTLIIERESTQCWDASSYRCQIVATESATTVSVTSNDIFVEPLANPDQIDPIEATLTKGYHGDNGRFDYGSSVELFCNATVGIPQQFIQWCVKYSNESFFHVYSVTNDVTQNLPFQESRCQFRQEGSLVYNITDTDVLTQISCEVTKNSTVCGLGAINANFTAQVVYARVAMTATQEVTVYRDAINVTCSQSTSGEGLASIDRLQFYKTSATKNQSLIFSINNGSQVEWHDIDLQNRSIVSGDMTSVSSASVWFYIPPEKILCTDEAAYQCVLTATTKTGESASVAKEMVIKTNVLPVELDAVEVFTNNSHKLTTGTVDLGATLTIKCGGSVGNPARNLTWCIRRNGETDYTPYGNVTQNEATIANDCQYHRNSSFVYNVTSGDAATTFLCEAGRNDQECGSGYVNSTFTINAVDVDISATAPESVTSGQEDIVIHCSQSASGQGTFQNIELSINRKSLENASIEHKIVSIRQNASVNSSVIEWYTDEIRQRSSVSGDLFETKSAFLELTFNGSYVTCLDEARYKCEIKVLDSFGDELVRFDEGIVKVKVIPDQMRAIMGRIGNYSSVSSGAFESKSTIELLCNSTVGDPPEDLFWCIKRSNDTNFHLYSSTTDVDQSTPSSDGFCQLRRTSTLIYNVTMEDLQTTLMCLAASNSTCDEGFINSTYTAYVVDTSLKTTTSENVMLDVDALAVYCNQTGSGNWLKYGTAIHLSKFNETNGSSVPLLSLTHNISAASNVLQWFDISLEQRSSVFGDVTSFPAFLKLTINSNSTVCEDGGKYICTLETIDITGNLVMIQSQADVNIKTLPSDMKEITATSETTRSVTSGLFEPGSSVRFSCTSKVGDPPQNLTWCLRQENDTSFNNYLDPTCINQTEPVSVGFCQFQKTSFLSYNVTLADRQTVFSCQAGTNTTCGMGNVQKFFNLYAADMSVRIDVPKTLIPGKNSLTISCSQSGASAGIQYISRAHLYKNTNGLLGSESSRIVSITHDRVTGSIEYDWHDASVQQRAIISSNITSFPGNIQFQIEANSTECEDAAQYRCKMVVIDVSGRNLSLSDDGTTVVINIPGKFGEIIGTQGNKSSVTTGAYETGSSLKLSCTANVGLPPMNLTWCIKHLSDTDFLPFPDDTQYIQTGALPTSPCQFSRTSVLSYNVSIDDTGTQFVCAVQSNGTCDGAYGQALYTLFAVDVEVETILPTSLILGREDLQIECRQTGNGSALTAVTSLTLLKSSTDNITTSWNEIVSLRYDKYMNFYIYHWGETDVENRAAVSGKLLHPGAFLKLYISSNSTMCQDAGVYRCLLEALDVSNYTVRRFYDKGLDVINPPNWISDIVEISSNVSKPKFGAFEPGDEIELYCNASVGSPPENITWCLRRENDSMYTRLDTSQSEPVGFGSCDNLRSSNLFFNVTDIDTVTNIICSVGNTCNISGLNSLFLVNTLNTGITISTTKKIKIKYDRLEVSCLEIGNGRGVARMRSRISIYKEQPGTNQSRIVSVEYNFHSRSSVIQWYDINMRNRSSASGEITPNITMTSFLNLTIDANSTTCDDSSTYLCELAVPDITGLPVLRYAGSFVDKEYIPDFIEDITGQIGNRTTRSLGVFNPNDTVLLTCNASVGYPARNLTWCLKRFNEIEFSILQNNSHVNLSAPYNSCNNIQTSTLVYEVTDNDNETVIVCNVGENCASGVLNASYRLHTVDVGIQVVTKEKFILGNERLDITCLETGTGQAIVRMFSKIHLSKTRNITSGNDFFPIMSVEYDPFSRSSIIIWHDTALRDRALGTGEISLLPAMSSKLRLTIEPNATLCEDAAIYRCIIEAPDLSSRMIERVQHKAVDVDVLPDEIQNIQVYSTDWLPLLPRSFEIGTQIQLWCSGTVGKPPGEISWCIKRLSDQHYKRYNESAITQSDPDFESGCQYQRSSGFKFNVTSQDQTTEFLCETTNSTSACGVGFLNSSLTIYAIDVEFSINVSSSNVTIGQDGIEVIYTQSKLGVGLTSINRMQLSRNSAQLVSVETGNIISWQENSVQSRASAYADITSVQGAYLHFSVQPLSTACEDAGTYRCQVLAVDASNQLFISEKEETIELLSLPDPLNIDLKTSLGSPIPGNEVTVGTAVQITCEGSVGKPARSIEWCIKTSNSSVFVPYFNLSHINDTPPSLGPNGDCKYHQSSMLSFILPDEYLALQISVLCEAGRSACGTGLTNASVTFNVVSDDVLGGISHLVADTSGLSSGALTGIVVGIVAATFGPLVAVMIWKKKFVSSFLRNRIGGPEYRIQPEKYGNIGSADLNPKMLPPISTTLTNGK